MADRESDADPESSGRKGSTMSIENPLTPDCDGDSIATESDHEHYSGNLTEKTLEPRISRASSAGAGAIGGVLPTLHKTPTVHSVATTAMTTDPAYEVDFDAGDTADPQNWPLWYKGLILFVMSYGTTCVVLYSTSYTSAIPGMERSFGATQTEGILGVTTYLLGMATGAVILAPLSEMFGRRPIYIIALGLFVVFVIPCAVARNMETILVTRFFGAFCAAAMISNAPGTVNDIVDDEHRALAFSIWSVGPMNGPVV
ncbi:hypothetical protein KC353_g16703, partial [Hortaea werneckii]